MASIVRSMDEAELRRQIVAIQTDAALSEAEKASKRQALLTARWQVKDDGNPDKSGETVKPSIPSFLVPIFSA